MAATLHVQPTEGGFAQPLKGTAGALHVTSRDPSTTGVGRAQVNITRTNNIIAAISGKNIVVTSMSLGAREDSEPYITNGSTTLFPPTPVAAQNGIVLPHNPQGWFESGTGNALVLQDALAGTLAMAVLVTYELR